MARRDYAFQIRIELLGVEPPVWRRIQIAQAATFWDLHVAIQDAMGWQDSHLHAFRFVGSDLTLGIPDEDGGDDDDTQPGWRTGIRDKLGYHTPLALYEYDFGDSWLHEVRFEKMVEAEAKASAPRCVDGARRCPPEDCGGPGGYEELLRVLADPDDDDHESMREWCGGRFDPEEFDAQRVRFQDPAKRWREVFEDDDA